MLDTALQPYTDVADLFVIDPDGFVIRYDRKTFERPLIHILKKYFTFFCRFVRVWFQGLQKVLFNMTPKKFLY
jgi:hypothetical protein